MNQEILPIILGGVFTVIGAVSFWGRSKLSHFGAKASATVNPHTTYERAYGRRIRYGIISGIVFLTAGIGLLLFGFINLTRVAG